MASEVNSQLADDGRPFKVPRRQAGRAPLVENEYNLTTCPAQ